LLDNGKAINVPYKKYDIYQDINPEMLMNCHFFDITPSYTSGKKRAETGAQRK